MKKFKKLMSALIACAMLLAIAIPVASVAADGEVAITVETVEANAGDKEVEVKLFISVEPHWSAIDVTFNFDPAKISFVEEGFETNEAVSKQLSGGKPAIFALNEEKAAEGEVLIAFASSVTDGGYEGYYNVDRKGNVYEYFGTFMFDVADDAEGLQEITVTVGKFVDAAGENVPYVATKGGIQLPGGEEPPVDPCDHEWGEWEVTTPATCVAKGEKTRTCSKCQETETEEIDIDPDAHDWGEWEDSPDKEGYEQRVCKNDPSHIEEREKAVEPPQPGEGVAIVVETVEANAGDKEVEVKLFIAAEPHWSAIDVTFNFDPTKLTFVEEGFETNEAVSKQLAGGKPAIFALNEEKAAEGEVLIAFASSVTDGGYEGYYNVDKKGNVYDYFGTFMFDVAEGLEDGLYEITVTVGKFVDAAGDNVEYNTTNGGIRIGAAACEHEWNDGEVTVQPTCTEAGKIVYTCTKCGETREETIDALGHDWGEWVVTTPATCTEKGEETRTCQREGCGATETREIEIDPDAHDWVEIGRTPATCAAEGSVQYACSINPDHTKEETLDIDPDAHDWGEWTDSPDKEGYEQRVCKNDPTHIEEREKGSEPPVPTNPVVSGITDGQEFDLAKDEKPAPTWEPEDATATLNGEPYTAGTEIGETGEYTLVVTDGEGNSTTVNFTVVDNSSEPPCDHEWGEWVVTTPATCVAKGEQTRTCSKCGETETEEIDIDPTAHDYQSVVTEPTCTEGGYTTYTCSRCGDTYTGDDVAPLGHDYGAAAYTWAEDYSTCTATRVCSRDASHVDTETVTATKITVVEPTTEADGQAVYTATFTKDGFETQTMEVTIPKLNPEEPTAPAVSGITDGQEFDLAKGEKPAPTWEPADAPATLDDGTGAKPYTAGTAIDKPGTYTLTVTGADGTATTIRFTVKDSTPDTPVNPDQPNTSDMPVAGIAIISLIAAAAIMVIARKKRLAK